MARLLFIGDVAPCGNMGKIVFELRGPAHDALVCNLEVPLDVVGAPLPKAGPPLKGTSEALRGFPGRTRIASVANNQIDRVIDVCVARRANDHGGRSGKAIGGKQRAAAGIRQRVHVGELGVVLCIAPDDDLRLLVDAIVTPHAQQFEVPPRGVAVEFNQVENFFREAKKLRPLGRSG